MSDLKRFLWQSNGDGTYLVTDRMTGKEHGVSKTIGGKFYIDGCTKTMTNYYGQETPYFFKNKFEVMEYLKEGNDTND